MFLGRLWPTTRPGQWGLYERRAPTAFTSPRKGSYIGIRDVVLSAIAILATAERARCAVSYLVRPEAKHANPG